MNRFPPQNEIIDSILKGMITAKTNYTFWTADELYLSYAPPKFLTIHVSQEIAKLENSPEIFIDATIADILRCSLPKRDSFRWFMSENNITQDVICLTLDERFEHKSDNDSISKVIMSIRNGVRNAQDEYKHDIDLICKMLSRDKKEESTLDYGVFAFYLDISNTARKKSTRRIEEIVESFDKIVASHKNLKSSFKGGDINIIENIGEWCVGCYVIEPTF
ncbi:hypothetical protein [Poseidonibacter lekithochrous]|uniref:hypothetical protein n=1 Tax=Poseidonibacter lekithochrous TaxID=1904463 RepID=UPI0008FCCA3F|nr:hypothetical protein [Poseidonibacter lekithochrous]QKJ21792.1 hypothetical protein ALEK_0489 [Poseidonibacter lekithochrous]